MPVKTLVKIHGRNLSETKCHAGLHEDVDFAADEKCSLIFKNGIELHLDTGKIVSIAFAQKKTYDFEVQYPDGIRSPGGPIIVP